MENERHYFRVGLFVLGGALLALIFTLWLTTKPDDQYQRYRIRFAESVSGLSNGSAVKFRGVSVGNVESIVIDPSDSRLIQVDIKLLKSTPVKIATKAALRMQGITGLVFIELSGGDPSSPDLAANTVKGAIPEIPAQQSGLNALIDRVPILLDKLSLTIDQVNKLVSDKNIQSFDAVLKNSSGAVSDIHNVISSSQQDIRDTTAHLKNAAANADRISQQIDENPASLIFPSEDKGIPAP